MPVNDTHGHDAGADEVLRVAGARLRRSTAAPTCRLRLGGDEFCVVLHDCATLDDAAAIAQRIIDALARPIRLADIDTQVSVGASAGVATLRRCADRRALAQTGRRGTSTRPAIGRNRVAVAPPAPSLAEPAHTRKS